MSSKLLLTPLFLANQAFGTVYESYAGAIFDEQIDVASGARGPSVRHSSQTRIMLHALVCGEDLNCPYVKRDFFNALRHYGCNCYSKKQTAITNSTQSWWHMEHHGAPVDAVDQACLDVANSYRNKLEIQ